MKRSSSSIVSMMGSILFMRAFLPETSSGLSFAAVSTHSSHRVLYLSYLLSSIVVFTWLNIWILSISCLRTPLPSQMSGNSAANSDVGVPMRTMSLDGSMMSWNCGISLNALRRPLRTCSSARLVGAMTATLSPLRTHSPMDAASTDCVLPEPGTPHT